MYLVNAPENPLQNHFWARKTRVFLEKALKSSKSLEASCTPRASHRDINEPADHLHTHLLIDKQLASLLSKLSGTYSTLRATSLSHMDPMPNICGALLGNSTSKCPNVDV